MKALTDELQIKTILTDSGDTVLVIPTECYYLNQDLTDAKIMTLSKAAAEKDVAIFIKRLRNGEFNCDACRKCFRIEIGSEQNSNPIEYALIAKVMIDKITELMADSEISYDIYLQIGRGGYEFTELLEDEYFDRFFDDGGARISELDEFGFIPKEGLPYEVGQVFIDKMMSTILGDSLAQVDGIRHHMDPIFL